jgi:arylsulfatase A-like enzyme
LLSLDDEMRRLLGALQTRGVLDQTIVVVTSDHGELIAEHGLNGHSTSLYLNTIHVPLVIRPPQQPTAGQRIATVVSLRDLPATILALAAIADRSIPGMTLIQTDSSAGTVLESSPAISEVSVGINERPPNPTYYGDLIGVIDDSLHVIRDGTGAYQVFDYQRDPDEKNDLARDPKVAAWARGRIVQLLQEFHLRSPGSAHVVSN